MLDKQMCISQLRQLGFCFLTDEKLYKEFLRVYPSIRDNSPVYQIVIMDIHHHDVNGIDKFFVTINGWAVKPTGMDYSKSFTEMISYEEGMEKIFNTRNFSNDILEAFRYLAQEMLYDMNYPETHCMTIDELKEYKVGINIRQYKHAVLGIHSKVNCEATPDEVLPNDKVKIEEHIGYYSDMNPRKPKEKLDDI